MKKPICFVLLVLTLIFTGLSFKTSAQTSSEILNKAIAFYDPQQKWTNYSGKVHLITIFANGNTSGGEIIEIGTKENFYQCTRPPSKTVFGIKNGGIFREINGDKNPDADVSNKLNLGDDRVRQMKGWHYFHFGMLMELKASGMVLMDKVEKTKFQGNDCYTLRFTYDETKIKNEFYKGTNWTFYIDPIDYSMKGFKGEGESINIYSVFSGILTINELKIPLCRTYFNNKDNSFYMVDIFTLD